MFVSLKTRTDCAELMDDARCDEAVLRRTLARFSPINRVLSRSRSLAARVFGPVVAQRVGGEVSLLDVGAGGADFARWFHARCAARVVRARVTCVDSDPRVRRYARERCAGNPDIVTVAGDVLSLSAVEGSFDLVFANHLLHHVPDAMVPEALRQLDGAAREALLVNDLLRSRLSYMLYGLFCAPLLAGTFAGYDGRVSIRRGFLAGELRAHIASAGLDGRLRVGTALPGRVYVCRQPRPPCAGAGG